MRTYQKKLSSSARACPRNLTGSDQRMRKDKRQTCKNLGSGGWAFWWRHTTAFTTSSEFIIYSANKEVEQQFLGWHDIVVIRNRGNLWQLLSACKHLMKRSYATFCPHSLLQLGAVPIPAYKCVWASVKFSWASHTLLCIRTYKKALTLPSRSDFQFKKQSIMLI
jgi:hypothetical protein